MEQIVINVHSDTTLSAIKNFVNQFSDAAIEDLMPNADNYYMETYGLTKPEFENRINTGIAKSVLGVVKPWSTVKEDLLSKIKRI